MNFTYTSVVVSLVMMRTPLLCALFVAACTRGVRKDVTRPLAGEAPAAAARQAGLADAPALSEEEMVEHLLARLTFGPRQQDRARVAQLGLAAFVEEQLHPEELEDSVVEPQLAAFDTVHLGADLLVQQLVAQRKMREEEEKREEMVKQPSPAAVRGPGYDYVAQLSQEKVLRTVFSQRQLQEQLVDFWFNHFNVFAGKDLESALLPDYERVLRANALSTFPDLLEATAHSPAMLIYLDNWRSAAPVPDLPARMRAPSTKDAGAAQRPKRGLNENYARELLELHTLGVDGGYTQADIVEVARCFTGWTVENPQSDPRFVFRPGLHDFGEKHVLGHLIPAGHGEEDGKQVLRILGEHPSTARFIARKLARRFVSDDPPESLVLKVSEAYERTRGDVRSLLRAIFESPEFWSRRALRAKVRSPLELVAGAVRALDATVSDPKSLVRAVARIGEPLYAAQPPTGYPDLAQTWLSSGAVLARIDFGLQIASGQLEGVKVDLSRLAAAQPEVLLQKAAAQLGASELSRGTRVYLLDQLQQAPPKPALQAARAVGLLLGAPEAQRR